MRAISLLTIWKLKNTLRTAFTDPRKLVFIIIIAVIGSFWFVAMSFASGSMSSTSPGASGGRFVDARYFEIGFATAMVCIALGTLDYGLSEGMLVYGRSDLDYLFPSPLSRRIVLAYRLPGMLLGLLFQVAVPLIATRFATQSLVVGDVAHFGTHVAPGWVAPLSAVLGIGTYLNFSLYLAIAYPRRKVLRRWVSGGSMLLLLGGGVVAWKAGIPGTLALFHHPVTRTLFWPVLQSADVLYLTTYRQPVGSILVWQALPYAISLGLVFVSNANWYEESLTNSERVAAVRQAVQKGGASALTVAKAVERKRKQTRTYIVRPFGQGPVALLWAHLSAAAKRPWPNFIIPSLVGIGVGGLGAFAQANSVTAEITTAMIVGLLLYMSMGFLGTARAACEAAVRRRELVAPLPIGGRAVILADLAVPWIALFLISVGTCLAYAIGGGQGWLMLWGAVGVAFPLRMATRMVLQYGLVLANPDFSDKLQQMMAQFAYGLFATPLLIIELVALIPAILLRSIGLGVGTVIMVDGLMLFMLIALVGRMCERSIATGESVRFKDMLGRQRAVS